MFPHNHIVCHVAYAQMRVDNILSYSIPVGSPCGDFLSPPFINPFTPDAIGILHEDDYFDIVPNPDKYMNRDGVTNQVMLPYLGEEDLSTIGTLIAQTDWQPTAVVNPKSQSD